MARIVVIHCEIDTEEPLGPQLVAARAAGIGWKIIQEALRRAGQPSASSWLRELASDGARAEPAIFRRDDRRRRAA